MIHGLHTALPVVACHRWVFHLAGSRVVYRNCTGQTYQQALAIAKWFVGIVNSSTPAGL